MKNTFKMKQKLLPQQWEEQYKKDFFEVNSKEERRTKYAVAIADPGLGEQWWRQVYQMALKKTIFKVVGK